MKLLIVILFFVLSILPSIAQDYEWYAKRNRRRRPHQQAQQYQSAAGPCGRFFGLSYINLNYNVDCSGHGGGSGSIDDFIGNHYHTQQGGLGGQGLVGHHRPQKPHRPHGGGQNQQSGNLFDRPIWGTLGSIAGTIGETVGSFSSALNNGVSGSGGGNIFDGSIINSFASLFAPNTNPPGASTIPNNPQRPPIINRPQPAPVTEIHRPLPSPTAPTSSGLPNVPEHPVVPIVDLRPVHENFYDEVTESTLYYAPEMHGSSNSKFLTHVHASNRSPRRHFPRY